MTGGGLFIRSAMACKDKARKDIFSNICSHSIVIEYWNTSQFTARHRPGKWNTLGECSWEQSVDMNNVLQLIFTLELLFTN